MQTADTINIQNTDRQKQSFANVLKHFVNFTGKHTCWRLFLIKCRLQLVATLLKGESNTGVFL